MSAIIVLKMNKERVSDQLLKDLHIGTMQSKRFVFWFLTLVLRWNHVTMNIYISSSNISTTDPILCYPVTDPQKTTSYSRSVTKHSISMSCIPREMTNNDVTVYTDEERYSKCDFIFRDAYSLRHSSSKVQLSRHPRYSKCVTIFRNASFVSHSSSKVQLSRHPHLVLDLLICPPCPSASDQSQHLKCILYTKPTRQDLPILNMSSCTWLPLLLTNMNLHNETTTDFCRHPNRTLDRRSSKSATVRQIHNCYCDSASSKPESRRIKTKEIPLQNIHIEAFQKALSKSLMDQLKNMSILLLIMFLLVTCRFYVHVFDYSYRKHSNYIDYSKENIDIDNEALWYGFSMLMNKTKQTLPHSATHSEELSSKLYKSRSRLSKLEITNIPQEIVVYPLTGSLNGYLKRVQDNGSLSRDEEMCYEVRRFQSFNQIQMAASPLRLARSGFYATGCEDQTRCYSCGAIHRKWELRDHPDTIHRRLSPGCPHLTSSDPRNIPMRSSEEASERILGVLQDYPRETSSGVSANTTSEQHSSSATAASMDVTSPSTSSSKPQSTSLDIANAVYPQYKDLTSRLESYKDWRYSHIQTPEDLSQAGFYYAGYRDCVRCFYCGLGLKTWEQQDDPWVMHVRWRSTCDYVRELRGEEFIQHALNQTTPEMPEDRPMSTHQPRIQSSQGITTEVLAKAEEMGFTRDAIDRAVRELTESLGGSLAQGSINLETVLEKLILMTSTEPSPAEGNENGNIPNGHNTMMTSHNATQTQMALSDAMLSMTSPFHEGLSTTDTLPGSSSAASTTDLKSIQQYTNGTMTSGFSGQGSNVAASTETEVISPVQPRIISPAEERRLAEENESLREESTCKVCMDNQSCIVFLPCGHLVTCAECAPALRRCPICRSYIRGSVRAHTTSGK